MRLPRPTPLQVLTGVLAVLVVLASGLWGYILLGDTTTPVVSGGTPAGDVTPAPQPAPTAASPLPHGSSRPTNSAPAARATSAPKPKDKGPRVVTWLQELAPASGGADGIDAVVYDALLEGRCSDALEESKNVRDPLYPGAAKACLAALDGKSGLWKDAERDLALAKQWRKERAFCTDLALIELLEQLIALHRQSPDTVFIKGPPNRGYIHCPRLLDSTSTVPSHGPATGGYEVIAYGEYLPATVTLVDLAGDFVAVGHSNAAGTETRFVMPPADPTLSADQRQLVVQTESWSQMGGAIFAYDEPPEDAGPGDETP